jgi:hypothetical protein
MNMTSENPEGSNEKVTDEQIIDLIQSIQGESFIGSKLAVALNAESRSFDQVQSAIGVLLEDASAAQKDRLFQALTSLLALDDTDPEVNTKVREVTQLIGDLFT